MKSIEREGRSDSLFHIMSFFSDAHTTNAAATRTYTAATLRHVAAHASGPMHTAFMTLTAYHTALRHFAPACGSTPKPVCGRSLTLPPLTPSLLDIRARSRLHDPFLPQTPPHHHRRFRRTRTYMSVAYAVLAREPDRAAPSYRQARAEPVFPTRHSNEPARAEPQKCEPKSGSDRGVPELARVQPYTQALFVLC
jgi:hypothetical protein